MKSLVFSLFLTMATFMTVTAHASTTFVCRSGVQGNVDRAVFSEMTLTVDGDKITGKVLTEAGPVAIGTETSEISLRAQITSNISGRDMVSVHFFHWWDQEELTFELRPGRVSADYYESIDGLDEIRSTEEVKCEKL